MEGGLSDRALKVLRAVLHLDFSEMPDPAVIANGYRSLSLPASGLVGYAKI